MDEKDIAIYQNSNTYRLHADNLRWTLLAGYVTFRIATLAFDEKGNLAGLVPTMVITLISLMYMMILAVQNWFYNLFAQYVVDCESKLISGDKLRSMQDFAKDKGKEVTPFHPAFYFALVIIPLGITITIYNCSVKYLDKTTSPLTPELISIIAFLLMIYVFHWIFGNWNKYVYVFITRLSNIYKTSDK